ncbi:hypothetical protein C8J57DRAFT_1497971 [Mycena rebaudengoi]|nr:hypothetical protein C8J57DRAFT_1497971 [Mycena rebaudengoi]
MGFFNLQPTVPPLPESLSFAGKVAVVTGANSGLGLGAALHLAQRNISTLILAVRKQSVGETTKATLLADPFVQALATQPTILVYELDLARPSSVASFASKIISEIPALNILLLNAGMSTITYGTTPETNSERVLEVNYLSNAILSVRLLPLLRASAEKSKSTSYISIVSSRALPTNSFAKYPIPDSTSLFDFMNDPKQYRGIYRYGDSKMLVSLWVRELAKHTDASVVTVNNVCPGLVSTNIDVIQVWWLKYLLLGVRAVAARSQEVGARTLIYAASAGTETHGEMLADYNVWQTPFWVTDQGKKLQKKLWEETLSTAELLAPGSVDEAKLRN